MRNRYDGVKDTYELDLTNFLEHVRKRQNLEDLIYNEMCDIYRNDKTDQYEIKDLKINKITINGKVAVFHLSIDYEVEEDRMVANKPKHKKEIGK